MAHQGSGSAVAGSLIFAGIIVVLLLEVEAANFNVGGGDGNWDVPTAANRKDYQLWASSTTFRAGDDLIFRYDPAVHSVLRVTPEAHQACNSTDPLETYHPENGVVDVKLESPGVLYFICGEDEHCVLGQKLSLSVREPAAAAALKYSMSMILAVTAFGSSILFL